MPTAPRPGKEVKCAHKSFIAIFTCFGVNTTLRFCNSTHSNNAKQYIIPSAITKEKNITNTCPGTALKDLTYENNCNNATYDLGAWAHAYLAYTFGADVLLDTFYPNLENLDGKDLLLHLMASL